MLEIAVFSGVELVSDSGEIGSAVLKVCWVSIYQLMDTLQKFDQNGTALFKMLFFEA